MMTLLTSKINAFSNKKVGRVSSTCHWSHNDSHLEKTIICWLRGSEETNFRLGQNCAVQKEGLSVQLYISSLREKKPKAKVLQCSEKCKTIWTTGIGEIFLLTINQAAFI